MPFKSEKQRRYLWANEPEIARDWTDTYGSGIHKALGGRIGFYRGSDRHAGTGSSQSQAPSGGPHRSSGPSPDRDRRSHTPTGPINPHQDTTPVLQQQLHTDDLNRRRQLGLLATRDAQNKINYPTPGPKVGGGGIKNFLGNWASTVGGSQLGGGLGSMLLGPWGMLLGTIFGGGAGRRAWKAGQTDEKETLRDILLGQDTLLSNLFKKKPTRQGIETIDIRDKFNRIKPKPINKYEWDTVVGEENPYKDFVSQAGFFSDFFTGGDKEEEEVDVNIYGKPEIITHGGKTYEMPSKVYPTKGEQQLEGKSLENYIKNNETMKQFLRDNPDMLDPKWLVGEDT